MKRGFEEKYPKKGNIILIQIYRKVNILNRILANTRTIFHSRKKLEFGQIGNIVLLWGLGVGGCDRLDTHLIVG
jgi:hypothetical protein